jgi:pentalenene oxygenase
VLEPTVVRRVLSDSKSFVKGVDYSSTFAVMFGEGLVTSGHEKHKRDRAIFNKYFIKSSVVKQTPMYNEVTERTIDQLLEAELEGKQEMNFNIERFFARLSLRVFMNYSTSTDYSNDLAREKEVSVYIQHFVLCLINYLFYLRFVTWFRVRVTQLRR